MQYMYTGTAMPSIPAASAPDGNGGGDGSKPQAGPVEPLYGLTEEQRKENHVGSEKRRREAIRAGFDRLVEIIPHMKGKGRSEALVLKRFSKYAREQLEVRRQLIAEMEAAGIPVEDKFRTSLTHFDSLPEADRTGPKYAKYIRTRSNPNPQRKGKGKGKAQDGAEEELDGESGDELDGDSLDSEDDDDEGDESDDSDASENTDDDEGDTGEDAEDRDADNGANTSDDSAGNRHANEDTV